MSSTGKKCAPKPGSNRGVTSFNEGKNAFTPMKKG